LILICTGCQYILVPRVLPTTMSTFSNGSTFKYYPQVVLIVSIGVWNVLNILFTAGICRYFRLTVTAGSNMTEGKWKRIASRDLTDAKYGRASVTIGYLGHAWCLKDVMEYGFTNLEFELKCIWWTQAHGCAEARNPIHVDVRQPELELVPAHEPALRPCARARAWTPVGCFHARAK
jgi:hypothetical protein